MCTDSLCYDDLKMLVININPYKCIIFKNRKSIRKILDRILHLKIITIIKNPKYHIVPISL